MLLLPFVVLGTLARCADGRERGPVHHRDDRGHVGRGVGQDVRGERARGDDEHKARREADDCAGTRGAHYSYVYVALILSDGGALVTP